MEQKSIATEKEARALIHKSLLTDWNLIEYEDGFELLKEIFYELGDLEAGWYHLDAKRLHKEIMFSFNEIEDTQTFLEFVADKLIHISSIIKDSQEKGILFPAEIKESQNDMESNFPVVISIGNERNFNTKYGKTYSGFDKIVSISTLELKQIEDGFNHTLLSGVARVEISESPIEYEELSLETKMQPCFIKNIKVKRNGIHKDIRKRLLLEANHSCQQCGAMESNGATLEVDHIVPISKGGSDDYENLQILCATCNRKKGSSF